MMHVGPEIAFVRDFGVIMAVAGVAILVFKLLKQPTVLGYLAAGMLVGPFTLPLFGLRSPISNAETVRLLADLGLVLLLFALGMEFGWQRIRKLGLQVVLIGAIETAFMVALGYEIGILLGWSGINAVFLGAALAVSSSAVIVKMLRDNGALLKPHGRMIVGILVVEDFVAVLLLSIVSGVASSGAASLGEAGWVVAKLAMFLLAGLVLGALFAPRLMHFVSRFNSREAQLIVALALCFGLALVAVELGISAAAGAFIIGTVLGDTEHADDLARIISPIRDVFAAIFFVSVGMLIDVSLVGEFIVPALIVATVFMLGKAFIVTVATVISGSDGRTAFQTGMGTSQMGEFSLAIVKVGADRSAVAGFLYPVIVVATAITTLLYPTLYRSAETIANFIELRSPRALRHYVSSMSEWLISLRMVLSMRGETAQQIRRSSRILIINVGMIVLLIAVGTFVLNYVTEIADFLGSRYAGIGPNHIGVLITVAVISFCTPSAIFIWRALQTLTDRLAEAIIWRGTQSPLIWGRTPLKDVLRTSFMVGVTLLVGFWSLPFFSRLVLLNSFMAPIPVLLFIGIVSLVWRAALKTHHALSQVISHTFLGERPDHQGNVAD